jgi:hypothetical protein
MIRDAGARQLFPRSRAPEGAMAGLYFYFDCWKEAHETAQDIATPEGSYWHAMVHRQEPDAGNSGYWFRQVGAHAIYPALRDAAAEIGIEVGRRWKPEAFIELCERARQDRNSSGRRAKCSGPSGSCCSTIARSYESLTPESLNPESLRTGAGESARRPLDLRLPDGCRLRGILAGSPFWLRQLRRSRLHRG